MMVDLKRILVSGCLCLSLASGVGCASNDGTMDAGDSSVADPIDAGLADRGIYGDGGFFDSGPDAGKADVGGCTSSSVCDAGAFCAVDRHPDVTGPLCELVETATCTTVFTGCMCVFGPFLGLEEGEKSAACS